MAQENKLNNNTEVRLSAQTTPAPSSGMSLAKRIMKICIVTVVIVIIVVIVTIAVRRLFIKKKSVVGKDTEQWCSYKNKKKKRQKRIQDDTESDSESLETSDDEDVEIEEIEEEEDDPNFAKLEDL